MNTYILKTGELNIGGFNASGAIDEFTIETKLELNEEGFYVKADFGTAHFEIDLEDDFTLYTRPYMIFEQCGCDIDDEDWHTIPYDELKGTNVTFSIVWDGTHNVKFYLNRRTYS